MPDLRTRTSEQLHDRLTEIETELGHPAADGQLFDDVMRHLADLLREIGLIHIELARRTATGWRPM